MGVVYAAHDERLDRPAFEGRGDDCARYTRAALEGGFHDPEGMLSTVRSLAYVGERDYALATLDRVVGGGCYCSTALTRDPWLDSLRGSAEFLRILRLAEAGRAKAAAAYLQAGGERILGVGS
jgi:hypothetical protein